VVGGNGDTTSGDVLSVATGDGATAIGTTASAAQGIRVTDTTTYSVTMPIHTDGTQTGMKGIAWDPRTAKFVLMVAGKTSGAHPSNLYWVTSTDGVTWSASVGWKRMQPSWTGDTTLEDFAITPDGIWLVTCRTAPVGGIVNQRLLASIDSGANWQEIGLGVVAYQGGSSNPWRFGSTGPGLVMLRQSSSTMASVFTGGIRSTGAEIASVNA
jgi:hypothetical protein